MTLETAKKYLRVDTTDDDDLIQKMLNSSEKMCMDILRSESEEMPDDSEMEMAILYGVAYMYEHREEADFGKMNLSLRDLLAGKRREVF